jgi:hypothetical protein
VCWASTNYTSSSNLTYSCHDIAEYCAKLYVFVFWWEITDLATTAGQSKKDPMGN